MEKRASALAWAIARLPSAEFAVFLNDVADEVLEVVVDDRTVATATLVRSTSSLSRAPLVAAVLAEDGAAASALAEELAGRARQQPAIELLGPGHTPSHVARVLADLLGGRAEEVMRQRLWICRDPVRPAEVPGRMRPLDSGDLALAARWLDDFSTEALRLLPRGSSAWREELRTVTGMRMWVVDDEPVSMARGRQTTPISGRVAPVYTPAEHRGRGYAAALTAALTTELLAEGLQRVVLLTDVTNPTSNRLYARVGYIEEGPHENWVVRRPADDRTVVQAHGAGRRANDDARRVDHDRDGTA